MSDTPDHHDSWVGSPSGAQRRAGKGGEGGGGGGGLGRGGGGWGGGRGIDWATATPYSLRLLNPIERDIMIIRFNNNIDRLLVNRPLIHFQRHCSAKTIQTGMIQSHLD